MALPEQITVRVGEERVLHLPSASGAGYGWSVYVEGDADAVRVTELDADRAGRPPGESAEHVFRLSPIRPGRTILRFEQRRPWERDAPARETREVEVTVSD